MTGLGGQLDVVEIKIKKSEESGGGAALCQATARASEVEPTDRPAPLSSLVRYGHYE
jgi:hypothetical protein